MRRPVGLKRLLLTACLLVLAPLTSASIVYRMEGGHCTDSSRELLDIEGPTPPVVGPRLCSNRVVAELRMRDSYFPGGGFGYSYDGGVDPPDPLFPAESFYFSDGFFSAFVDFGPNPENHRLRLIGSMPEHAGRRAFFFEWGEGWGLRTDTAGGWRFLLDFGASRQGVCGIGSMPGLLGEGALCNGFSQIYESVGTYGVWRRTPEPAMIILVAAGLFGLAVCHGRRLILARTASPPPPGRSRF